VRHEVNAVMAGDGLSQLEPEAILALRGMAFQFLLSRKSEIVTTQTQS